MKILQISDFHVGDGSSFADYEDQLGVLCTTIKSQVRNDEGFIIVVCGDLINQGALGCYSIVGEILNYLRINLCDLKPQFEIVPGNHDVCNDSLEAFIKFIDDNGLPSVEWLSNGFSIRQYNGFSIALVNSCRGCNTKYGEVDPSEIITSLETQGVPLIWVTHHALFSHYADDASAIRSASDLISLMSKYNSIAYIHGHIHGYSDLTVGDNCKVFGVGPFLNSLHGAVDQFNLITINGSTLLYVENYAYGADLRKYSKRVLYENKKYNCFSGNSLIHIYDRLVSTLKECGVINNLNFSLECSADKFLTDVNSAFSEYHIIAEKWLAPTLPSELYYNHAQYINSCGDGVGYVISQLDRNATSSRAILSLINMKDVINSGDNHLPSLDVLQFGFRDESRKVLRLTVYLRALEVNHFLKINISEMAIIVEKVCAKFRSIKNIELNIIAFRAQYKQNFGCFVKADIDKMSSAVLTAKAAKQNVAEIVRLLRQKQGLSETVVHDEGVRLLRDAISAVRKEEGEQSFYSKNVIDDLDGLLLLYNQLMDERKRSSIHECVSKLEKSIDEKYTHIIHLLEENINNEDN